MSEEGRGVNEGERGKREKGEEGRGIMHRTPRAYSKLSQSEGGGVAGWVIIHVHCSLCMPVCARWVLGRGKGGWKDTDKKTIAVH